MESAIIGLVFALLEISIVIGEILGWINYNSRLDSGLFIIFLVIIVSYQKKKQNKFKCGEIVEW